MNTFRKHAHVKCISKARACQMHFDSARKKMHFERARTSTIYISKARAWTKLFWITRTINAFALINSRWRTANVFYLSEQRNQFLGKRNKCIMINQIKCISINLEHTYISKARACQMHFENARINKYISKARTLTKAFWITRTSNAFLLIFTRWRAINTLKLIESIAF